MAPAGQSGSDQQAGLSFEDQSGDNVVVDTVSAPQGGFVVISVDEDGREGTLLGSTQLQVGTTDDAEVTLDPPLTQDTDLTATRYAGPTAAASSTPTPTRPCPSRSTAATPPTTCPTSPTWWTTEPSTPSADPWPAIWPHRAPGRSALGSEAPSDRT